MKRLTLTAVAVALLIASTVWIAARSGSARADDASETRAISTDSRAYLHSFNLPSSGLALEGYCPVAYFAVNKPVLGDSRHASDHNGVTYHFVSADAKQAFDANPEKYLPAFGGWCAFGMAVKDKFPVDPRNFKIVDGKLLVFLKNTNVDALELWNQGDDQGNLTKASAHWRKVSG